MSFDKSNPAIGFALRQIMNMLITQYHIHRIEFRCVGGNPVKRHYDNFCKRYNGRVIELKDVFKDRLGSYHNDYIYEIIFNNIEILNKLGKEVEELKEDNEINLSKYCNGNICICCGKPVDSNNKCIQVCNKCASEYEF